MGTPQGINLTGGDDVIAREDEGQVVHLTDAQDEPVFYQNGGAGEPKPVTVRIAGTYSKRYRQTIARQQQRALKQRRSVLTPDLLRHNQIELVAACILSWEGILLADGTPAPCTLENATALLERHPGIYEQLESAQADHAGFSPKPSTS